MMAEIAPALEASAQICGERLRATAQEMRAVLQATTTAASVNYGVAGAALFDARGRCVALDVSDAHLLAAIRRAPRALVEAFSFDLEDGDVIASNHPDYHGVGPTVLTVVAPAFLEAQYVGAAAVQFQVGDLGGDLPGAWTLSATDALAEGLALPPLKVLRAGRPAFDAWDLLLLNSRQPADLDWDLRAMIGACRVGQAALQRLIARVQSARFAALCGAYLAYAERRARAMIGATADMRSPVVAEVVRLPERGEVTVRVAGRRDDRGCAVDLRACDRVVGPRSYLPRAAAEGAVLCAVLRALPALPPLNDGALDVVTVVTDSGTVVDPPRDAATSLGTAALWPAVLRATARALDAVGLRTDETVATGPRVQVFTPPPGSSLRLAGGQPLLPEALTTVPMPSVEELERDRGVRIDYREQREDGRGIDLRMTNAGSRARLCGIAGDGTLRLPDGPPGLTWCVWESGQSVVLSDVGEGEPHD
jgi:N-methylhydantoinase B